MIKILSNSCCDFFIREKNLYLIFKNLNDLDDFNINKIKFYYSFFHIISFEKNIKYKMIINFLETEISYLMLYNKINDLVKILTEIKAISNHTVKFTLILVNSKFLKKVIDLFLSLYENGRPIYIINNYEDINLLIK